jgi:hypothetical protein
MAYEFAGYFARPPVPYPEALPPGAVWREISAPFVGVGVRLPSLLDDDALPSPPDLHALATALGLHAADRWSYLTYICWGGDIDFVYGLGFGSGVAFGPVKEDDHDKVEAAYTGLMEQFGVAAEASQRFEPFMRGYWVDA